MPFDLAAAKKFVRAADLANTPRSIVAMDADTDAGTVFEEAKRQAQVVGSGVFSFAEGVDVGVREAISDSALFAQLIANKQIAFEVEPLKWFGAYEKVLENVGWTLQESGWSDYTADGNAANVNEKIIEVIGAALAPAPAALSILTSTVNALKAMKPDSSWITIFSRESTKAKIARFQIGLVETGPDGGVFVSLLACLITADATITQLLFFKYRESHASFRANSAKVSINRAALSDLGPVIRGKIRAYQNHYLSSIADLL
jgi:hypothetical protein